MGDLSKEAVDLRWIEQGKSRWNQFNATENIE
jgi:hypothetical protein